MVILILTVQYLFYLDSFFSIQTLNESILDTIDRKDTEL